MFEMSSAERLAAIHAMGGTTPDTVWRVVIFLLSTIVLTWLLVITLSAWRKLQQGKVTIGDFLLQVCASIFVVCLVGWLII